MSYIEVHEYDGDAEEYESRDDRSTAGERHYAARLREDDVRSIRRRARDGERQCDLADEFGMSRPGINNLIHGRSWGHVSEQG